jgi:PIN domain nuclease of toxin-antitoxin system
VRLLLDTCTLLWYCTGSEHIGSRLQSTLTDPRNELLSSDVSLLEIVIKCQLGKLDIGGKPSEVIPSLLEEHSIDSLAISGASILALEGLPLLHRDPFDRLLVAQAKVSALALVTPDPLIRQYDVKTLWY